MLDSSCKYGLIEGDETCGNMWYHHGDVYVHQGVRHTRDHSCLHCGHDLPGTHWSEWPRWTGEFVLGVDPPARDNTTAQQAAAQCAAAQSAALQPAGSQRAAAQRVATQRAAGQRRREQRRQRQGRRRRPSA